MEHLEMYESFRSVLYADVKAHRLVARNNDKNAPKFLNYYLNPNFAPVITCAALGNYR